MRPSIDLILWRHAEAVEPQDGQEGRAARGSHDGHDGHDDLARPLTAKGERQAARMANWLNRQLPASTRVLVSPARRTQQTAAALDRKCKTVAALAPGATVEALLHSARWPDAREPVLIVGHQPTLGLTAAYLLAAEPQNWSVRKGAVWWLRARERDGTLQVTLHAVVAPEQV